MERAFTGKPCLENEWELKIFAPKINQIVKQYDIKYDPETPVPSDNSLADDVYNAAFEFFADVGFYCTDTERIIKFEEEEIKEALKAAPSKVTFGEGKDAKTLTPRKPEDQTPPFCSLGAGGTPISSEEIFLNVVECYAYIPEADGIMHPILTSASGLNIRPRSPIEIMASIRSGVLAREATGRVGRPGLAVVNAASYESSVSVAAAIHPKYGWRITDGYILTPLEPLKLDFERLNKLCVLKSLGAPASVGYGPLMGGYSGGPEGTAVADVAGQLLGAVCQSDWYIPFPVHIKHVCSSFPEILWVISMNAQAVSRNTHLCSLNANYAAAGPGTDMALYETAAAVMSNVASGFSIYSVLIAKAASVDYIATPLESRLSGEVAHGIVGMKRVDVNEIVKSLIPKYVDKLAKPPMGKSFQEWFDPRTRKPRPECFEVYNRVKKELEDLGLKFEH